MKKLLVFGLLLLSLLCSAQWGGEYTRNWLEFPNSETLNSSRTVRVQHNIFIDPMGTAPNGRGGRQFGYEFTVIMGGIYVAPSVSTFPQLEDGYTDVVGTVGVTWHMCHTTLVRYYSGLRIGYEFRGGSIPHPLIGASLGADIKVYTFYNDSSVYIGGEVWVDYRASQAKQFYGGSDGNMERRNGKLKLGYRFK